MQRQDAPRTRWPKSLSFWERPRQHPLRAYLFTLHWFCGMVFGLYFAVVCITGSLVVYKKELERLSISDLLRVEPGPQYASFQQMFDTVRKQYPDHRITNAYLYQSPGSTWSFRLQGDDGRTQVYVDPYTGAIVGEDRYQGAFLQWAYNLHSDLLLGDTGLVVNAVGGFALLAMCVSGLVIWWPGIRKLAFGFSYAGRAGWKRQVYDVHKLAGVATLLPLALLAVTGAYWGFPAQYEIAFGWLSSGEGRRNAPVAQAVPEHTTPPSLDEVLSTARAALPPGESTLFTFSNRPQQPHSLRVKLPGDWRSIGDHSAYIHPATGKVLRVDLHHQLPLGVRLQRDLYGLHFGTFWGHASRIAWVVIGVGGFALFFTGWMMYWNRVLLKRWRRLRSGNRGLGVVPPLNPVALPSARSTSQNQP